MVRTVETEGRITAEDEERRKWERVGAGTVEGEVGDESEGISNRGDDWSLRTKYNGSKSDTLLTR